MDHSPSVSAPRSGSVRPEVRVKQHFLWRAYAYFNALVDEHGIVPELTEGSPTSITLDDIGCAAHYYVTIILQRESLQQERVHVIPLQHRGYAEVQRSDIARYRHQG